MTGYDMAPADYDGPAVQRSHAMLPAVLWARSCLRPGTLIVPEITSIVPWPLPGRAAARGEDPLTQEGSLVQVPVTVQRPPVRLTAGVVRT